MRKNSLLKLKTLLLKGFAIFLLITGVTVPTISCSDPISGVVLQDAEDEKPPDDQNDDPNEGDGGGSTSANSSIIIIVEDN